MRQGNIQGVSSARIGIAANGDVANKIGTYSVAVLARAHGIPFYVAAPYARLISPPRPVPRFPSEERNPSK